MDTRYFPQVVLAWRQSYSPIASIVDQVVLSFGTIYNDPTCGEEAATDSGDQLRRYKVATEKHLDYYVYFIPPRSGGAGSQYLDFVKIKGYASSPSS